MPHYSAMAERTISRSRAQSCGENQLGVVDNGKQSRWNGSLLLFAAMFMTAVASLYPPLTDIHIILVAVEEVSC
jgi:hypothetical protein